MDNPQNGLCFAAKVLPWHQKLMRDWLTLEGSRQGGWAYLILNEDINEANHFVAQITARLFCKTGHSVEPCLKCKGCRALLQGAHGDLLVVSVEEGKTAIGIDQIRAASNFLQHTNIYGDRKLLVIQEADKMTLSAANSVLKTLEEPSGRSTLLLSSSASWRLPPTIRSRCQRLKLPKPQSLVAIQWLESHGYAATEIEEALTISRNLPLEALINLNRGTIEHVKRLEGTFESLTKLQTPIHSAPSEWKEFEQEILLLHLQQWIERKITGPCLTGLSETLPDWLMLHRCISTIRSFVQRGTNPAKEILYSELVRMCVSFGTPRFASVSHSILSESAPLGIAYSSR